MRKFFKWLNWIMLPRWIRERRTRFMAEIDRVTDQCLEDVSPHSSSVEHSSDKG